MSKIFNKTKKTVRLLLVEDVETDALLTIRELERSGMEVSYKIVDNAIDFEIAIETTEIDIIVSDYKLPDFTGLEALKILNSKKLDIPFVLLSGVIIEETAISAMRDGARDCIMKENLARLAPAIERELVEKKERIKSILLEREAKDYRQRLDDLVRNLPVGIFRVQPEKQGKLIMVNPSMIRMFGYSSAKEFFKLTVIDLFNSKDDYLDCLKILTSKYLIKGEILPFKKKDGTTFWGSVTLSSTFKIKDDVEFIDGVIEDYTERKMIQETIIQSEKMVSIGGLAAGIAHEINNPLAGMMHTAKTLTNRLSNREIESNQNAAEEAGTTLEAVQKFMAARGVLRMLETINESGERVSSIVKNMLSFARKSEAQVSSFSVIKIIENTLQLAAIDYDLEKHYDFKNIEIRREFEDNLPNVPCEDSKIQQVLLNLIRNGTQAMQIGGTKKPAIILRATFEKESKMVRLEIEDNGPGIDQEIQNQIFQPFFTTKPVGSGTGLGLSLSYFIITKNHKGEMFVESQPGFGAKFIIRLPIDPMQSGESVSE